MPKERLTKAENLERAASGSMKMTSWLKKVDRNGIDWDDDPDLPELEEIEIIEAREQARTQ